MMNKKNITALFVAFLAGFALVMGATGGVSAQVSDQSANVGDFEEIAVTVDYSGTTDTTINITDSSGSVVESKTVSPSTSGGSVTETFNVESGDYTVDASSTDETAVNSYTVDTQSTLSLVGTETLNVSEPDGEKITTEVEFTAGTSALVEVENSTGDVVDSQRIDVSSVSDSSQWESVEFTDFSEADNYTVRVSAESLAAINQTESSVSSTGLFGGGGTLGGASMPALIGFVAIVGGLVYAYREDYI